MERASRQLVRERAGDQCEYCRIHQNEDAYFRFHVEHIVACKHGGTDDVSNLALACRHCNLHKGPNLSGIDPADGAMVALFNPRCDSWQQHFEFHGPVVAGRTPIGRATVRVLAMNDGDRIDLRLQLGDQASRF